MATFTWVHDRNPITTVTPRIVEARFGDGYSQRARQGINNLDKSWSLRFTNRTASDIDAIVAFLEARGGWESFQWAPPGSSTYVPVVCKSWSETQVTEGVKSLTAKFERVYE